MPAAHTETRQVEISPLGERLSALRLCEATAVTAVRRSLEQHGQLSAVTLFAAGDGLEIIDGPLLARLLFEHGVGVRTKRAYEVKEVDDEYFIDD